MSSIADQTARPNWLTVKIKSIMDQCAIYAFTKSNHEVKINFYLKIETVKQLYTGTNLKPFRSVNIKEARSVNK